MKNLLRLWRGEVALWKSFWLLGVLGKFLIAQLGIVSLLSGSQQHTQTVLEAVLVTSLIHTVFSIVCIWRSAGNYTGERPYGFLVKALIVLWCVGQVLQLGAYAPGAGR